MFPRLLNAERKKCRVEARGREENWMRLLRPVGMVFRINVRTLLFLPCLFRGAGPGNAALRFPPW